MWSWRLFVREIDAFTNAVAICGGIFASIDSFYLSVPKHDYPMLLYCLSEFDIFYNCIINIKQTGKKPCIVKKWEKGEDIEENVVKKLREG